MRRFCDSCLLSVSTPASVSDIFPQNAAKTALRKRSATPAVRWPAGRTRQARSGLRRPVGPLRCRAGTRWPQGGLQAQHPRRAEQVLPERKSVTVERLDHFDDEENAWSEVIVEDRRAGPADTARARLDFAAWLKQLPHRNRRVAQFLSVGNRTSDAAQKFGTSAGESARSAASWPRTGGSSSAKIPPRPPDKVRETASNASSASKTCSKLDGLDALDAISRVLLRGRNDDCRAEVEEVRLARIPQVTAEVVSPRGNACRIPAIRRRAIGGRDRADLDPLRITPVGSRVVGQADAASRIDVGGRPLDRHGLAGGKCSRGGADERKARGDRRP